MNLVSINNEKCMHCYSCVRICPVKAIQINAVDDTVFVNYDKCIGCGSCLNVCSRNAVRYASSIEKVKNLLKGDVPVFAICDPDISAEFTDISDYKKFVSMIKNLGFKKVFSSSLAVEIIAQRYNQLLEKDFNGKYYITANCPVVVNLVEKYYPKLLTNLSPVLSPVAVSAKMIRQQFDATEIALVYLSPCLAQKEEISRFDENAKVNAVLMFRELRKMFEEMGIEEHQVEYSEFDNIESYKGLLYPINNGILQAGGISEDLLNGKIVTTNGKMNVMSSISSFDSENEFFRTHMNAFFCQGCIMGPGTSKTSANKFIRQLHTLDYARKQMQKFDQALWTQEMEMFSNIDISCSFKNRALPVIKPMEEEIAQVMKLIHEENNFDDNAICGMCGYSDCRELAIAIIEGTATLDMCRRKMTRGFQGMVDNAGNEDAAKYKAENDTLTARLAVMKDTLNIIMNQVVPCIVLVNDDMKIVQANNNIINVLGEEAQGINEVIPGLNGASFESLFNTNIVNIFEYALQHEQSIDKKEVELNNIKYNLTLFYLKNKHIAIGIFRRQHAKHIQLDALTQDIQSAIDENLKMVQRIGYVLGEGAAKTERSLNQIIESFED